MNETHELDPAAFQLKMSQATMLLATIKREQSFSKAAEKLGIHQSAVSHRLKHLEETLGFSLFERTTRQLKVTPFGEILCQAACDCVDRWEEAYRNLETYTDDAVVRLSVSSSLATKWLMPHMQDAQRHGVDIMLDVNDGHSDFNQIDAAIRFGVGPYSGLHSTFLSKVTLTPVIQPNYSAVEDLEDLLLKPDLCLLKDRVGERDRTHFSWAFYTQSLGLKGFENLPSHGFDRADLMLQAAMNGMGVALGRTLLIEQDIAAGFLRPIGPSIAMPAHYSLVCRPSFAQTRRFKRLSEWLKNTLRQTPFTANRDAP